MNAGMAVVLASLGILSACQRNVAPLVADADITGDALPRALDGRTGSPERGRMGFADRDGGHCVLCHVHAGVDAPFQGDIGPDLTTVGDVLTPGQIRLRIVDMSRLSPDTVMPPYHRIDRLHQVEHGLEGKPVLSSQEIEDLVAFLSLKTDQP